MSSPILSASAKPSAVRCRYSVSCREEGRGKASVTKFATLDDAARYVKDRWQGAEYMDGPSSFHTDYCSYELRGFALADIGKVTYDDCDRFFTFNLDRPAPVDDSRRCKCEDCDGGHCRTCGGHFVDFYSTATTCDQCLRVKLPPLD